MQDVSLPAKGSATAVPRKGLYNPSRLKGLIMVNLRCSKCGSDAGFLIETQAGKTMDVRGSLSTDRIKASVRVTCLYCNLTWDHAPVALGDEPRENRMGRRQLVH